MAKRLVVGISGASGVILGIRLLEVMHTVNDWETHLIISNAARITIAQETDRRISDVEALATQVYDHRDIGAALASGSFVTAGMVIVPCSIKTLSAVANCYTEDLMARAADVTVKEGRSLVLVLRETPLHRGHIRLMQLAAEMGAVLFPPVPAFYSRPQTVDDIINSTVGRVLARLGIENELYFRWEGMGGNPPARNRRQPS